MHAVWMLNEFITGTMCLPLVTVDIRMSVKQDVTERDEQDRKAAEPNEPPPSFSPPDLSHAELGIQLMADWEISSNIVLYSFLSFSQRQADVEMMTPFNFLFESNWTDQLTTFLLGSVYEVFEDLELYLEHSFAQNTSLEGLSFSRHLFVSGVRYDYR